MATTGDGTELARKIAKKRKELYTVSHMLENQQLKVEQEEVEREEIKATIAAKTEILSGQINKFDKFSQDAAIKQARANSRVEEEKFQLEEKDRKNDELFAVQQKCEEECRTLRSHVAKEVHILEMYIKRHINGMLTIERLKICVQEYGAIYFTMIHICTQWEYQYIFEGVKYEKFFMAILQAENQFADIGEIISRHAALIIAYKDLLNTQLYLSERTDLVRSQSHAYRKDAANRILV